MSAVIHLHKSTPGADSFGHTWETAGDVVAVPYAQAVELLAIPDGGFTAVPAPAAKPVEKPAEKPRRTPVKE